MAALHLQGVRRYRVGIIAVFLGITTLVTLVPLWFSPTVTVVSADTAKSNTSTTTLPLPAAAKTAQPNLRLEHVVIISEDGLRPDILSEELTPRHMRLMREGTTASRAETIPQSDTLPSHAAMLSGVGASKHGLWWNSYQNERGFIKVPTIFSVAREHGLSTAMIVGKPKLRHIALPDTVDYFERPSYLCGGVSKRAAEYFKTKQPNLLFVHFSDPDEWGHSHGWMSPEYSRAVRNADRCLGTFLDALGESGLAGSTLVIVTADHGGHGKQHSGGHVALDRSIPWIVRGPGIAPGGILDEPMVTVDTAATALAALRLPGLPEMVGTSRFTFELQ